MKWLICILTFSVFAQNNQDPFEHTERMMEQFLKSRQRIMEEVMKAFEDDKMIIDKYFDDDEFLKDFRKGQWGNLKGFSGRGQDFTIEERSNNDGSIDIIVTPKDKNVNLDIKTENGAIVIKSETKVKEENEGDKGTSTFYSSSSYTRSIAIPEGYKAQDPEAENNSIKIALKPSGKKSASKNGRRPIEKRDGDESL